MSLLDDSVIRRLRGRGRRVVAAAAHARDRTIGQLVALLVPLIRATRYPLLVVLLAAAVPAVTVILVALLRPGPDDGFWIFLGVVGLVVAGWFGLRRHQLLAIAQDPDALADALASVVSGRDMWEQLVQNVSAGRVGAAVVAPVAAAAGAARDVAWCPADRRADPDHRASRAHPADAGSAARDVVPGDRLPDHLGGPGLRGARRRPAVPAGSLIAVRHRRTTAAARSTTTVEVRVDACASVECNR